MANCKSEPLKSLKQFNLSSSRLILLGFAVPIVIGAILLALPLSSSSGESIGWINALFTSTSAVCVTGLAVVDTGADLQKDFMEVLFEVTSAFGTVGLSMGLTPELSPFGKGVIILTMYIGRLGPLTLAFALSQRVVKQKYRLPEEKVLIG